MTGLEMQRGVDGNRILSSIRWIAREMHLAGTSENENVFNRLADEVWSKNRNIFSKAKESFGIDFLITSIYKVT